jgi:hypothetical protein
MALLVGVVIGVAVVAAGARATPTRRAAWSEGHPAPTRNVAQRVLVETPLVPVPAPMSSPPSPAAPTPELHPVDWGNPYDLMLHGIPLGPTHDMRPPALPPSPTASP